MSEAAYAMNRRLTLEAFRIMRKHGDLRMISIEDIEKLFAENATELIYANRETEKQHIIDLALNLARLEMSSSYINDGGHLCNCLNLIQEEDQKTLFLHRLIKEASNLLLRSTG